MTTTQPTPTIPPEPTGLMTRQRMRQAKRLADKGPRPVGNKGYNRAERRRREALLCSAEGLLIRVHPKSVVDAGVVVRMPNGQEQTLLCRPGLAAAIACVPDASVMVRFHERKNVYQALRMGARGVR